MKNSTHKYFIQVDGVTVDLNQIEGLSNMEDFLNLSIFTGLFGNEEEMVNTLVNLGFPICFRADSEVGIVKRVGSKKRGYSTKPITTEILYKKHFKFLSPGTIKQILYLNRNHSDMISELLNIYRKSITMLIEALQRKLERLEEELYDSPVEYKSDIRSEINSRKNSLKIFHSQEANIIAILDIVKRRQDDIETLSRVEECEYIDRLEEFVNKEAYYFRAEKRTPNNRGLVRLAVRLTEIASNYPDLKLPSPTKAHDEKRKKIASAVKTCLERNKPIEEKDIGFVTGADESEVLQLDPDDYMFLTEEDFEGQLAGATAPEQLEAYEDMIENLREKQGQFSDEYTHRRFS